MACGTGAQSIAFAKKGFSVVGVDLSPDMLVRAKNKVRQEYDVNFICQDAAKVDYPDSCFDLSSISFGLHDMPEEIGAVGLEHYLAKVSLKIESKETRLLGNVQIATCINKK